MTAAPKECQPGCADLLALANQIERYGMTLHGMWHPPTTVQKMVIDALRQVASLPLPEATGGRERAALEEIGRYAKKLRKSADLIGPSEYFNDAKAMKVWQRALYHEGKTIAGMVKAGLHGSEISEPNKAATSTVSSTVRENTNG